MSDSREAMKRPKKQKVLTGLAAKQAIMRAICRAIERDKPAKGERE